MKGSIKISLLTLAVFGLTATSCRKIEEPMVGATDNSVDITTSINGAKKGVNPLNAATKASEPSGSRSVFVLGDKIGVYVVPYITPDRSGTLESSGNYVDNMSYTFTNVSGTNTWVPASKIFYPNVSSDLYGFAPYDAKFTPAASGTVLKIDLDANQSTTAAIEKADFMTAKVAKQAATTTPLDMTFFHRFAKVKLHISVPATRLNKTVHSVSGVKLIGFKVQSDVDVVSPYSNVVNGSGAIHPKPATVSASSVVDNIVPHKTDDGVLGAPDKYFMYEAIVVPQTFIGGTGFLEVELRYTNSETEKFYYKVAEGGSQEFFAGNEHLFNISFATNSELLLGSVTIQDWGKAPDTNGEVVETVVFNQFTLNLTAAQATQISKVKLNCNDNYSKGGYTLHATHTAGEKVVTFAFDGSMESPEYYPYIIKSIQFYDGLGAEITTIKDGFVKEVVDAGNETLRAGVWSANSYIVKPGASININAMRAGNDLADTSAYSKALAAQISNVKILWQTMQGHAQTGSASTTVLESVSYAAGVATVKARTGGAGGNAVVAAFDAGNNILWSWHIWVSPVDETAIPHHTYGSKFTMANGVGKKIMDRNLGAISAAPNASLVLTAGMLYQWGRKDPFVGAADVAANPNTAAIKVFDANGGIKTGAVGWAPSATAFKATYDEQFSLLVNNGDNIVSAVKYPMTFYVNDMAGVEWTVPQVIDLWKSSTLCSSPLTVNNKGDKTIYDPCPAGYRVPTGGLENYGAWGDLGPNGGNYGTWSGAGLTVGRTFTSLGGSPWYPATMMRLQTGIGNTTQGYCYSATMGYCITFNALKVEPTAPHGTRMAIPTRCVQE